MFFTSTVQAERYVIVNGERMNDGQIALLEQVHCGPIPNGNYWLDTDSGLWGYAGNAQAEGYLSDNCINPGRRPSLSERGMLFGPSDW
jgi:hypothetical protein